MVAGPATVGVVAGVPTVGMDAAALERFAHSREVLKLSRRDIGFAVVRGGDIVGEHEVMFAGQGERLVLRHVATDRAIFARGALRAALWGLDRPPGEYDMRDVLGL